MRRVRGPRAFSAVQWLLLPTLAVLVVTVVLAIPLRFWGWRLPEPVAPLILAFAWPLIRPSILAPVALFGLGVFLDLFWGGTLGLWPLALTVVYGLVLFSRSLLAGQDTRILFFWFTGAVLIAFFVAYWTLRLDVGAGPAFLPVLWQIVPTLLLFPAADWLVRRFDDADMGFR